MTCQCCHPLSPFATTCHHLLPFVTTCFTLVTCVTLEVLHVIVLEIVRVRGKLAECGIRSARNRPGHPLGVIKR